MTTAVGATLRLRRESTLRSRAARGDAAAFTAVYERHHQALYRYCRSILRHEEDAQDALQSTMTRAFAALQDEQRDFELKPWLFRIAHNEAISILRKRRATAELDDIPVPVDLDDQVSEREQLRLLAMDLADLPDRQRAALVLRELNGLSHAEIAVVLETSASSVKQTIYEARTALFSAREGREMPCQDVRRLLSDGDGRVLRGRGVRAHLRTCASCRAFRDDIGAREKRLAMLAPPLPAAGAVALLAEILGGGTAKLLACVAIAGGGATVAAKNDFYKPPPQVTQEAKVERRERTPTPTPTETPAAAAVVTPVATAPPAKAVAPAEKPRKVKRKRPRDRMQNVSVVSTPAARSTPRPEPTPAPRRDARKGPRAEKPPKVKPPKAKKPKLEKPANAENPRKHEQPGKGKQPDKQQAAAPAPTATPTPSPTPTPTATPVPETPRGQAQKQQRGEWERKRWRNKHDRWGDDDGDSKQRHGRRDHDHEHEHEHGRDHGEEDDDD